MLVDDIALPAGKHSSTFTGESFSITPYSGADKWLFITYSVQIFNKEFFALISFAMYAQYATVGGTDLLF